MAAKFIINYENRNDDCRVNVARNEDDNYGSPLCRLVRISSGKNKGSWALRETEPSGLRRHFDTQYFKSAEDAATAVYAVWQTAEEVRQAQPLPEDVERYLTERARHLLEEERKATSEFLRIRIERHKLRQFAERNQISSLFWTTEDTDVEAQVRQLLEFEVSVKDNGKYVQAPLFSETALYNLIGKEDARTVRVLLERVCGGIAPVITEELL